MHSSDDELQKHVVLDELPKLTYWETIDVYQWEGFWFPPKGIKGAIAFQSNFKPRNDDVILASFMKTGTTWLKALCFCIMRAGGHQSSSEEEYLIKDMDLLVENVPHAYVPTLESQIYIGNNHNPDLSGMASPSPRLFHTHFPYKSLPNSIKNSECKIVYIARNPKDTFVSMWYFLNTIWRQNKPPFPIEKAFDNFCDGVNIHGPFFQHVLEYWLESLRVPQKILFLKYEDLKRDPKGEVKRLASFLGKPFVEESEIDKVLEMCSLERLKNLEVNKNGMSPWIGVPNSAYFRLGVVGDWKNCLTPSMSERIDQIMRTKLEGSGLDLGP